MHLDLASPADAIAAVTHRDPYPYYAALVRERPIFHDGGLGLWVASGAAAVTAALTHEAVCVRPASEPVPRAIAGTAAGDLFGRLVRMNDGERHCPWKRAIGAALAEVDLPRLGVAAAGCARRLAPRAGAAPRAVSEFAFALPVHATGTLLGLPENSLSETADRIADFVRCLAPQASAQAVSAGADAAGALLAIFERYLRSGSAPADGTLVALARAARAMGLDDTATLAANGVGFLSQAYEATAGLVGNTLLALARHPALSVRVATDSALLERAVREAARHDAPVQNTRRFVATDATVAGQPMRAGEAILVVLAAANRDPDANPRPEQFDPDRHGPRSFTFGAGIHACPGETVAVAIAAAGVQALLDRGWDPAKLAADFTYRASANTRIPLFGSTPIGSLAP